MILMYLSLGAVIEVSLTDPALGGGVPYGSMIFSVVGIAGVDAQGIFVEGNGQPHLSVERPKCDLHAIQPKRSWFLRHPADPTDVQHVAVDSDS